MWGVIQIVSMNASLCPCLDLRCPTTPFVVVAYRWQLFVKATLHHRKRPFLAQTLSHAILAHHVLEAAAPKDWLCCVVTDRWLALSALWIHLRNQLFSTRISASKRPLCSWIAYFTELMSWRPMVLSKLGQIRSLRWVLICLANHSLFKVGVPGIVLICWCYTIVNL